MERTLLVVSRQPRLPQVHSAPPLFDWAFGESFAGLPEDERNKIVEAFATVADLLDTVQNWAEATALDHENVLMPHIG